MKRFLTATAAVGLALSLTAPLALAQMAPQKPDDQHKTADQHGPATVQHTTTVQHMTTVQHGPSIAQNGHLTTPGDMRPQDNHGPAYGAPGPAGHVTIGSSQGWRSGQRYTGSRQVVSNWSDYHVQRPPSGYEYVRDGNQLVLISIASGVIASVLANSGY
jgi:Ni/Co efflux regulator RcnB